MDKTHLELRVGLVAITAILILVLGTIWGKDIRLGSNYLRVECIFKNSGGLRRGDPVTVNGVKKGRVESVRLRGNRVVVTALVEPDVELYADASARIGILDLMGAHKLEILPGESMRPLEMNGTLSIPGREVMSIDQIMVDVLSLKSRVDTLLSQLQINLGLLAEMLDRETFQKPLQASIRNLYSTSEALDDFIREQQPALKASIQNLHEMSRQIRALLASNRSNLDSAFVQLPRLISRMQSFSQTLMDISQKLEKREGTLGKLIYEDELYHSLQNTLVQMDSLASEVKRNLGRYMQGMDVNLIKLIDF